MFINSTAQDWKSITGPKIRGAWNLHELLPKDLDFFVSLASVVGRLGNVGQSIYGGTSVRYPKFATLKAFPSGQNTNKDCDPRHS